MSKYINRLMARFGYVPAPAKMAPTSISLTIEVDSTQVAAALELQKPLEQLASAAFDAEAALARLWNIQAAMQNRLPETGVGSASGSSGLASASPPPEQDSGLGMSS